MSDERPEDEVDMFVVDTADEASAGPEPAAEASGTGEEGGVDETVQQELANLQTEVDRLRELYLRKMADFENYRKRQEREMVEFRRFANADLMRECLPVIDNLERALAVPNADGAAVLSGVELVLRQLRDVMTRNGLIEVDPLGEPFDPSLHEALQRMDAVDAPENSVVHVHQKGYLLGERLLRPALVVVATGAGGPESGGDL